MEVLILILKETYNICNFPGGGGGGSVRISSPLPLYGFITQKSRESVETIDAPQIYGNKLRRAAS